MTVEHSWDLPNSLDSPGVGRHLVVETLLEWDLGDLVDDAELVTSELVTNAVIHAQTACQLSLRLEGASVWIGVRDFGGGLPAVRAPDWTGGRGLPVVYHLTRSSRIDREILGPGKAIWCELARR